MKVLYATETTLLPKRTFSVQIERYKMDFNVSTPKFAKTLINVKRHRLVQISLLFKKTEFAFLKSIDFYIKTPNKQKLVVF